MQRCFLHPSALTTHPALNHSSYFTVYLHLCLQGVQDKVEVLVGPTLYSLLSGDEKHLSLFLVLTSTEVL